MKATTTLLVALAGFALAMPATNAMAADHSEAPGTRADQLADIADLYAWHDNASNTLTTVLTYAGLQPAMPRTKGDYDAGVVYQIYIDSDGDFVEDVTVSAEFSVDSKGMPWLHVTGLPGASGTVTAPVNRPFTSEDGMRMFAGLRDDPFFFDFEGFNATLQTGTLMFDGDRDSVAGLNAQAIVLEMDLAAALDGSSTLNVWATTARKAVQ